MEENASLCEMLPSDFPAPATPKPKGWRIVVVDRGFVFVGNVVDLGDHLRILRASCIRKWGTTRGLGELITGPTKNTVLDWCSEVDVPARAVIFTLPVAEDAWSEILP